MGLKDGAGLEQWEIAVVKKIVSEFRRRFRNFGPEDLEDLQQECLLHWIQVRDRIVPTGDGPPVAYMSQVLRNKLTDWTREQLAEKRGGDQEFVSIDAAVDGTSDGIRLADVLADPATKHATDRGGRDRQHAEIDVARLLGQLTPEQRTLCVLLGDGGLSVKDASERLGIPRGTLYEEIKRIRKIFMKNGFEIYLKD